MRFNKSLLAATALAVTLLPVAVMGAGGGKHKHKHKSKHHSSQVESIADAAAKSRRLAGAAVGHSLLSNDPEFGQVLSQEFNYITPENVGKWGPLQPGNADEWYFDAHDELVAYAEDNSMKYKGHALVWHSQAPSFINDELSTADLQAAIDNHILTTVGRYQGQIYAWDVVNEAIGDDGEFRDSVFYRTLGESYIAEAFYAADAADHSAKLYYNDYNIAGINAKSNKVYDMVRDLVESGVPIDGVGFQMHLAASTAPSYNELVENFRRFAELGLRINVSELDVRISNLPWDKATNLAIQRQVYHRVVSACMRVRKCEAVTTWGISDQYSWIDYTFGADDPLPWDEQYQRKPAYYGMVDGFMGIRPDSETTMPNLIANGNAEANLDGWSSWTGELERTRVHGRKNGSAVKVTNRSDSWDGVIYDISNVVRPGQSYDAAIWARVDSQEKRKRKHKAEEEILQLNVKYQCANESAEYVGLAESSVRFHRWSRLTGEVHLPDCDLETVALYVSGGEIDTDIIVDRASLRPQAFVPDDNGYGPNIVSNGFFEENADGWFGFGDAQVDTTDIDAQSGAQSLQVSNRLAGWQGPATSLLESATPGDTYELFSWVSVDGDNAWVNATVKAGCPDGSEYINITGQNVHAGTWTLLRGTFQVPECELSELTLYFEGPSAELDMYLDDVYVRKDLEASSDNIIENGGFENGTDGWQAWGGSSITTASDRAHSGYQSGLLTNRTGTWQGPVYDLLSDVVAGGTYEVNAWGMIEGAAEDTLNITVKTACAAGGEAYHQLYSTTVNDSDWTELQGSIVLPNCDLTQVFLYFDGPAAGVDIYIDDVEVTGTVSPEPENLVSNAGFEDGLAGWVSWGGNLSVTTDVAHEGSQSALLVQRAGSWEGPVYDLLSSGLEAGATYDISAWGRIAGANSDSMSITLKVSCDDGTSNYLWGGAADVTDVAWAEIAGSVTVPDCTLTEASLYFGGPAQEVDVYLDNVRVVLAQ
ncbi:Endo-1,4-beta-xylanase, GH35 family [Alteromonadaceae bacterium Bs31]|nr:Endo-1,4-beta-xylanase, GH35 family [Alteromonadaceae bacterium Bs31]